jgi:DNA-binding PadR family transcriptional regulator
MYGHEELPERSTLVLTSLAGGDKHGYALAKDIEDFAGARLGPGTLYGALARLAREGLIAALPGDGRRQPYRITRAGTEALTIQLSANERLARVGLARIRRARG